MKKAMLMFSGLLVSTAFVPRLFAQTTCVEAASKVDGTNYVAEVGDSESTKVCEKLTDALNAATTGDTVKLLDNVTSTSTDPVKRDNGSGATFILDLGGFKISSSTSNAISLSITDGSDVTITNGTIENTFKDESGNTPNYVALFVKNSTVTLSDVTVSNSEYNSEKGPYGAVQVGSTDGTKGTLKVEKGTKITGETGIAVFGSESKVEITGGEISTDSFAVSGNGNSSQCSDSTIEISGGILTSRSSAAIYQPQSGTLKITGGTITGLFGVVARQGTITITGGKIEAKGEAGQKITVGSDPDATELPVGTAIVVDNEANYGGEEHEAAKVTVSGNVDITSVVDPVYSTKVDPASSSETRSEEIVVKGGKFNKTVPAQFVNEGSSQSASGRIGVVYNVKVAEDIKNGTVSVSVPNAVLGEEVSVIANANDKYQLSKIVVTRADGTEVEFADGKFVMPASDVTVSATFVVASNPQTGDNIIVYMVMGVVSMVLVGISALYLKKN